MSMTRCEYCGDLIDTDIDLEAFDEAEDCFICRSCRDEDEDEYTNEEPDDE